MGVLSVFGELKDKLTKLMLFLRPTKLKVLVVLTCLLIPVYSWAFWIGYRVNNKTIKPIGHVKLWFVLSLLIFPLSIPFWMGWKLKEVVWK